MRNQALENFFRVLRGNLLVVCVFCLSTAFFLWQHSSGVSWDFTVYTLNARYIFDGGRYFEWSRPPLMPFLLDLFSIFGWGAVGYVFIILISALYLLSSVRFSERFAVDYKVFYPLSLTPFALIYGFSVGTELLSLSMLLLFLAYFDGICSGFFLSMAFMVRYTNIGFLPMLLLEFDLKSVVIGALVFLLTLSPWIFFNYALTGNPLTSLMDSYAMNVKFRGGVFESFSIWHVLTAVNILLPLAALGMLFQLNRIRGLSWKDRGHKQFILVIAFALITFYSYVKTPYKFDRYLFNLALPATYFSAIAVQRLGVKIVYLLVAASFVSLLVIPVDMIKLQDESLYEKALREVRVDVGDCGLLSNGWVYLNKLGSTAGNAPDHRIVAKKIDEGYRILLFKHLQEPEYTFNKEFIGGLSVLKETGGYTLLGKNSSCVRVGRHDGTYIQQIDELYRDSFNESFSITAYELFFTDKTA